MTRPISRRSMMAATTAALALTRTAAADTWPTKPIRLVVPFSAGAGISDILARLVSNHLSAALGQRDLERMRIDEARLAADQLDVIALQLMPRDVDLMAHHAVANRGKGDVHDISLAGIGRVHAIIALEHRVQGRDLDMHRGGPVLWGMRGARLMRNRP